MEYLLGRKSGVPHLAHCGLSSMSDNCLLNCLTFNAGTRERFSDDNDTEIRCAHNREQSTEVSEGSSHSRRDVGTAHPSTLSPERHAFCNPDHSVMSVMPTFGTGNAAFLSCAAPTTDIRL